MKLLCALWHSWSPWHVIMRKRLMIIQESRCARCGKIRWRSLRARIGAEAEK